jgi:hypothetical protein
LTRYDNQSRSTLDTPQRHQHAGSQAGFRARPAKGLFTILRLYSPLEPFFTKEWRPSEIEEVK